MRRSRQRLGRNLLSLSALAIASCSDNPVPSIAADLDCRLWQQYVSVSLKPKAWTRWYEGYKKMARIPENYIFPEDSEPTLRDVKPTDPYGWLLKSIAYRFIWHARNYSRDEVVKLWGGEIRIGLTANGVIDSQLYHAVKLINSDSWKSGIRLTISEATQANFVIEKYHYVEEFDFLGHGAERACVDADNCAIRTFTNPETGILPRKYEWVDIDKALREEDAFRRPIMFLRDATYFTDHFSTHADGYVLSDPTHRIRSAICYIDENLPELALRELTSECVIRGLGFFNFIKVPDQPSVLRQRHAMAGLGQVVDPSAIDLALVALAYSGEVVPGQSANDLAEITARSGCK